MPVDIATQIEESFERLAPRGPELVDRFFAALFARAPQVRPLFPEDMHEQKRAFLAAITLAANHIRRPDALRGPLVAMGRRHAGYGAQPEHYPLFRDTLIEVMSEMAGDAWSAQLTSDWTSALNCVAAVMLEGHRVEEKAAVATR